MNKCRVPSRKARSQRAGTALIVAIICLTLTSAVAASLVRLVMASHIQVEREEWRSQSAWLAESALLRAAARLGEDPQYNGETWIMDDLGEIGVRGSVAITVESDRVTSSRLTITAVADYPDDPTHRARTTRTATLHRGDAADATPLEE